MGKTTAFYKKYKPNFHDVSQEFKNVLDDDNQTVVIPNSHDITLKPYNNQWKRSSIKKILHDDFNMFDNILDKSHESEMSILQNTDMSNDDQTPLNNKTVISCDKELLNKSKFQPNVGSIELLKQQSNVLQDTVVENKKSLMSEISPTFLISDNNYNADKSSQEPTLKPAQLFSPYSANKENEYLGAIGDLRKKSVNRHMYHNVNRMTIAIQNENSELNDLSEIQGFTENSGFFIHPDGLLTYDKSLKTVDNSLVLKNNVENVSNRSSRISKSASNFNYKDVINNSLYVTPSNKQKKLNKFNMLKTNKSINAIQISNKIKTMSIADYKSTHLRVSKHLNKQFTQPSFVTHQSDRDNLSILAGNETLGTISSQNDLFLPVVNANNAGRRSNCLLKSEKRNFYELEPDTEPNELLSYEELLNNSAGFLKQLKLPSNNSKTSNIKYDSRELLDISSNSFVPDDDLSNVWRMSTHSSEQISFNINTVFEKNKLSEILEARTFTSHEKSVSNKKSESNKSKHDVSNTPISYFKSLEHAPNTNVEDVLKLKTNDSIFRNTSFKDSASIVQNNLYQIPNNNKLQAIAEDIANTIRIMSFNNRKAKHPGVFKLEEGEDQSKTLRKKHLRRVCTFCSPLIPTKILARNVNTLTAPQSLPKTISDLPQVKENFKSLYNKKPWITEHLYEFLVTKLQPKYNINSMKYAEKFVKYLASILERVIKKNVDLQLYTDMLRYHMARYGIVKDTFDYLQFLINYIPPLYKDKLIPGRNLETSIVKFDPFKYDIPIMEDEEFLNRVLENLNAA